MVRTFFIVMTVCGIVLSTWATFYNPDGANRTPGPRPWGVKKIITGPYRFMKHPMYLGNTLAITGLAGIAAGWVNALAVGFLVELMMREWRHRDES